MVDAALLDQYLESWRRHITEDERVKVLWVEAATPEELRSPSESLSLHLAMQDPDYQPIVNEVRSFLEAAAPVARCDESAHKWQGVRYDVELADGTSIDLWMERIALIGKKPRAWVRPIDDKTGHFRFSLDFSLRENG